MAIGNAAAIAFAVEFNLDAGDVCPNMGDGDAPVEAVVPAAVKTVPAVRKSVTKRPGVRKTASAEKVDRVGAMTVSQAEPKAVE
jgi:hypothetical protein